MFYLQKIYKIRGFGVYMAFSRVLGIIHLDMLSSIHVRHFWKWEKVSHSSWVLSQLIGWIFILELFIDNSCNSAYFPRLITLELPKSPYSNYIKHTLIESTVFCPPIYHLIMVLIAVKKRYRYKLETVPRIKRSK